MASLQDIGDQEFLEGYSVPTDRAQEIRGRVQRLKEAGWIEELRILVSELGEEAPKENTENLALPGMGIETSKDENRIYRTPVGHAAEGLQILMVGSSLKVQKGVTSFLEITFLPKDDEFLVSHLDDTRFEELNKHLTEDLALEIKAAKAKKNERQAAWKARFSK